MYIINHSINYIVFHTIYTELLDKYNKEILPIKVKIITKLQTTFAEAMDNIVSYAKYMQSRQRRVKLTSKWPKEYLMDFMFKESKKKKQATAQISKSKERSVSQSPTTSVLRRFKRTEKLSLFNKMSDTYKTKKRQQSKLSYQKPRGHAPFDYKQKLTMDTDFDVCTSALFCVFFIYIHIYFSSTHGMIANLNYFYIFHIYIYIYISTELGDSI